MPLFPAGLPLRTRVGIILGAAALLLAAGAGVFLPSPDFSPPRADPPAAPEAPAAAAPVKKNEGRPPRRRKHRAKRPPR